MQLRTSARSALKTKQLGATVAAVPAAVRLTSSHAAAAQLSGAAAAAPRQMGVMHRNGGFHRSSVLWLGLGIDVVGCMRAAAWGVAT